MSKQRWGVTILDGGNRRRMMGIGGAPWGTVNRQFAFHISAGRPDQEQARVVKLVRKAKAADCRAELDVCQNNIYKLRGLLDEARAKLAEANAKLANGGYEDPKKQAWVCFRELETCLEKLTFKAEAAGTPEVPIDDERWRDAVKEPPASAKNVLAECLGYEEMVAVWFDGEWHFCPVAYGDENPRVLRWRPMPVAQKEGA